MFAQTLRDTLNAMPDSAFIADPDTLDIMFANDAAEQLTGRDMPQLVRLRLLDLHSGAADDDLLELIAKWDGKTPFEYDITVEGAGVDPRVVAMKLSLITLDNQDYLLGIGRDISARYTAEQRLRDESILYYSLIDAISDLMFRITHDGIYRDFKIPKSTGLTDPGAEAIVGHKVEEIVPKSVAETVMPVIQEVIETNEIRTVEYDIKEHDGIRYYEARFVPSLSDEIVAVVRDITKRKRESESLRFSEAMAHELLNASDDSAVLIDRDWKILSINGVAAERFGHTPEEMLGTQILDYFPAETAKSRWERGQELLEKKETITFIDTRDDFILYNRASPILDEEGEIAQIAIFSRDITKQRADEDALKHYRALFKGVAEAARHLLAPGNYYTTMCQAVKILGEAAQAERVCIFRNHTDPESHTQLLSQHCAWYSGEQYAPERSASHDNLPWTDNGLQRWYDVFRSGGHICGPVRKLPHRERNLLMHYGARQSLLAVPIFVNHAFWGFISLDDCRTEREWSAEEVNALETMAASLGGALARQRAENDLRQQRDFADTLREAGNSMTLTRNPKDVLNELLVHIRQVLPYNSASALLLVDNENARVIAAQGFEQYGYEEHELPRTLFHVADMPYMQYMLETHKPSVSPNVEDDPNWFRVPGTDWIQSWLGAPIIYDDTVQGFFTLDSMQRNAYNENHIAKIQSFAQQAAIALKNAQYVADIENLERIKSEIIRLASHDLRNPLIRIQSILAQLRDELTDTLTSDQHRDIQQALRGSRDMKHIITNILSLDRIETQHREAQPIYWRNLIDHAIAAARDELDIHRHQLTLECASEFPVTRGNAFKLERAIYNLIHNAIKYTRPGGHITVRAAVKPYGPQSTINIEVQDNGIGIPPERQAQLFQPFYRAQQSGTEHISGTGLGLSMIKSVIEEHNGSVYFDSVPGEGSIFGFRVPV